jgi:hypothetical protein
MGNSHDKYRSREAVKNMDGMTGNKEHDNKKAGYENPEAHHSLTGGRSLERVSG